MTAAVEILAHVRKTADRPATLPARFNLSAEHRRWMLQSTDVDSIPWIVSESQSRTYSEGAVGVWPDPSTAGQGGPVRKLSEEAILLFLTVVTY
jgi:hypothetical protein